MFKGPQGMPLAGNATAAATTSATTAALIAVVSYYCNIIIVDR